VLLLQDPDLPDHPVRPDRLVSPVHLVRTVLPDFQVFRASADLLDSREPPERRVIAVCPSQDHQVFPDNPVLEVLKVQPVTARTAATVSVESLVCPVRPATQDHKEPWATLATVIHRLATQLPPFVILKVLPSRDPRTRIVAAMPLRPAVAPWEI